MALAQLPDGAGVPALIQMVQDPKGTTGSRTPALEMLAQLALQSPEARAALLEQARLNTISAYTWQTLVPILAGDHVGFVNSEFDPQMDLGTKSDLKTTHLSYGNQNFYSLPGNITTDQFGQRNALLDELLSVNSNQAARDALQQSRDLLTRRQPRAVATAP